MARLHRQPERRVHALQFMSATTKCMELAHTEVTPLLRRVALNFENEEITAIY
ncbi:hypothetical protein NHJ6243_001742 [Beauveria neobassiana]